MMILIVIEKVNTKPIIRVQIISWVDPLLMQNGSLSQILYILFRAVRFSLSETIFKSANASYPVGRLACEISLIGPPRYGIDGFVPFPFIILSRPASPLPCLPTIISIFPPNQSRSIPDTNPWLSNRC
uniref:Uncharacterized protein n=1 Tax=Spongospora subterranea TaxID=70186 RepID=A0A0H5RR45_9EUKA|eukprot:CRZ11194.1 hypothetical protein [Spongospora subterranea]